MTLAGSNQKRGGILIVIKRDKSYLTILLVEDLEDSREVIKRTLELGGEHRILLAADGREAVEIARRESPDLILMDLNLPEMDGLAAATKIRECREACREAKIVAITAYDVYGMKEAALEAGCDDYIPKPINFEALDQVLRDLLLER